MPEIMIVEDDRDTRDMLERFLQLEGFEVRTAANGEAALHAPRAAAPPCMILRDLMMPVMNGWEFRAAQVRDPEFAAIPVVVVTAAGPRAEMPAIQADAWLSKPVDLDKLRATIDTLCPPDEIV